MRLLRVGELLTPRDDRSTHTGGGDFQERETHLADLDADSARNAVQLIGHSCEQSWGYRRSLMRHIGVQSGRGPSRPEIR